MKDRMRDSPLRLIDVVLRLDLLHPDLHSFLAEANVLLLHLVRRLARNVGRDRINGVADKGGDGEGEDEDDEGEDFGEDAHGCRQGI